MYALEDRNGLGRCPCWLRQLLLERSDGHRPDEVSRQREVHDEDALRSVHYSNESKERE